MPGFFRTHLPPSRNCISSLLSKSWQKAFACEWCGQEFATAAACKRHAFLVHLSEAEQSKRQDEVKSFSASASTSMAHAKEGMPWCRHCDRKFQNWPNFYYHISWLSCAGLRQLHQSQDFGLAVADMTEALVERPMILEQAKSCTWLDIASLPAVIKTVQHCPECHHWVATPQYLKRHMKAKHPDLAQLVDDCTEFVKKSNISITSPCRFCNICLPASRCPSQVVRRVVLRCFCVLQGSQVCQA